MAAILGAILLSFLIHTASAAECVTATVGSPYSTCWDIAVAANINTDQLIQFNPGLDCGALQLGQKLCVTAGDLPSTAPQPNPDGSCKTYTTVSGDYCALIGTKFGITAAQIEQFNANTYKWKGCASLQLDFTLCVSSGTPPPIPVNPDLQCGPESPSGGECPLKACCSAFGFCGMTDEFCNAAPNGDPCISNCGKATLPSCSGSQLTRKVGYYAGWAGARKCNPVGVDKLDLSTLTHVIYAFAEIDADMKIVFADATDGDRLRQLVTKAGSQTKVLIAVGGWTFSQGALKDRFSTMIASAANRATFIASAKAFIADYKIAGIDIDFEYPASIERNGPPDDTPNLTIFFDELRAGLGSSEISLATPAGYWFLKGFEMDKIAPKLDFINMMSYDYHGPWDAVIETSNSTAQPQSSLQDMVDSALLYVKAGVDLKQVNLGLAWYGRSYKLEDSTCAGYNCDMTGGGTKGECTGESGVLANFEIDNVMIDADIRPVHDKRSETRWFNYKGDLITFDDEGTWKAKTDFAAKTCFGGTMIWSIDQEIPKSNSVPGTALPVTDGSSTLKTLWEVPKAGTCKSYGTRIYSARLWNIPGGMDWKEACEASPITIKGVVYNTPDECEDKGFTGGYDRQVVCQQRGFTLQTELGVNANDGCTAFGVRKWYSRLWDISSGVDWMTMCTTTPNTIDGHRYDSPNYCDDKGLFGAWGVWHIEDSSCSGKWGDLKDNGCADTLGKREYSSKLFDIIGSWEDACAVRDHEVEDEYFSKPTKCEKHITGIWGVFEAQDSTCGVPPCPPDKAWDYNAKGCMDCGGGSRLMSIARELNSTVANTTVLHSAQGHSSFGRIRTHHVRVMANMSLPRRSSLEKRAGDCNAFWLPRPQPNYFPQDPLAWMNPAQAEGPTAAEIVESPESAWNDSFNTPSTAREAGGWIYADPQNPQRVFIRRAQLTRSTPMHQLRPPANRAAGINLNDPESNPGGRPPAGFVLVANFHTHPMGEAYGGNSQNPSTADQINAWARGVPGIIISRRGLRSYGPQRRAQLNAPQGYPNPNEEWGGQNSEGTRIGGDWTPNQAPNQQEP
ncbi:hypothetical protein NLJ89_g7596 [Agrocybe chaxingu]|uniref:Chitinase n=1 Tax=Agrocybe chaxingu TaxID=84603 RepID=A0A9W8MTJ1_9AGAR|nr:hypothetical protein NLJ89_g7596 [Agrocybe chaxingu]